MVQFFDPWEDQREASPDDDALDPEDIDMEDMSYFPARQNSSTHEDDARSGSSHDGANTEDDSSDYVRNELEVLETLRQFEGDVTLYEYWEHEGVLECPSDNGRTRRPDLLSVIAHNIAAIRTFLTWDVTEMEEDAYQVLKQYAMATKDELSHLGKHPEIFPSEDIAEEFWQEVYELCADIADAIMPGYQNRVEETNNVEALCVKDEHDHLLPARDLQRKPWEQYLHNKAPGVRFDLSDYDNEGSVQIFPMAAVRILNSMLDETRAIITDIESQREDGTPYEENPMPELYFTTEKPHPGGLLRSHRNTEEQLRPMATGPVDDSRNLDSDPLETLTQDFGMIRNFLTLDANAE